MYKKKLGQVRLLVRKVQKLARPERVYTNLSSENDAFVCDYCDTHALDIQESHRTSSSVDSESERDSPTGVKSCESLRMSNLQEERVPEGHLAVYVGRERRRFVIGTHYLNHALFRKLLERSAEQFGFDHQGGITIACEIVLFEHLLWLIGTDDRTSRCLQADELLDFYAY